MCDLLIMALSGSDVFVCDRTKWNVLSLLEDFGDFTVLNNRMGFTKTCNHPQSPPITQQPLPIIPNHPKYCHNHPQSPKILSQPPTITQNIATTCENVVTDSSNHPNIITQTQQIWLTLFCETTISRRKLLICEENY